MKKLLSLFLIIFSVFFLVSCQDDKKELVELTSEELNEIVSAIDFEAIGEDIFTLETNLDIKVNFKLSSESLEEELVDAGIKANGKFNVYANLKEFEGSYVYADIELSYELLGDAENFIEGVGDDYFDDELDSIDFEKFRTASFTGNLYLIEGVLYIDITVKAGGTTVNVKQYEQVFTEEEFIEFKEGLISEENGSLDVIDFLDVPEHFKLFTYQIGDSYQFEYWLDEDLDESIAALLQQYLFMQFEDIEINHKSDFKNYFAIKFSDVFEKLMLVSNMDVELTAENEVGMTLEASIVTNVKVDLSFKGTMPKNLPKAEDFSDYSEGFDLSVFE